MFLVLLCAKANDRIITTDGDVILCLDCDKEFFLCTRLYMSKILGIKQYSEIKSLYRDIKGLWYFGRITSSEKYDFFPRPEEMK